MLTEEGLERERKSGVGSALSSYAKNLPSGVGGAGGAVGCTSYCAVL